MRKYTFILALFTLFACSMSFVSCSKLQGLTAHGRKMTHFKDAAKTASIEAKQKGTKEFSNEQMQELVPLSLEILNHRSSGMSESQIKKIQDKGDNNVIIAATAYVALMSADKKSGRRVEKLSLEPAFAVIDANYEAGMAVIDAEYEAKGAAISAKEAAIKSSHSSELEEKLAAIDAKLVVELAELEAKLTVIDAESEVREEKEDREAQRTRRVLRSAKTEADLTKIDKVVEAKFAKVELAEKAERAAKLVAELAEIETKLAVELAELAEKALREVRKEMK